MSSSQTCMLQPNTAITGHYKINQSCCQTLRWRTFLKNVNKAKSHIQKGSKLSMTEQGCKDTSANN